MLSNKAQYAIHALTYLGERYQQGYIPINQIAEERKIPYKFLEAILLELRKAGILGSRTGKGGGYYLTKAPEEIMLVQIMRAMDGPVALLPCVSKVFYEPCRICPYPEPKCPIRGAFLEVRDVTLKVLGGKSLRDLINKDVNFPSDFSI
ncbi:RrF2 family transcriptional regulator [Pinibacter soli]|uniref:Rrf2 family transcriptional regulator n=1 Tax=Pinibacter soli TaxID=3044211 RepID=A0ABT6RL35_9BACT|nr:Rrf2 family transcriptional regulator [Pinibacter soli]MDH7464232.1 Rrf2 family transcriptional regulator [Chitinophagaceae bacterium 26-R-25]MDI3322589.1 Rrf2 family transcriptional regulator [Pinibacter soli]